MFTGVPAVRLHGALDNAINADASGYLLGPGGASSFTFNKVDVSGSHATENVTYELFTSIEERRKAGGRWAPAVTPVNRLTAALELTKNAAGNGSCPP